MSEDRIRRRVVVNGRVQGVFFRDSLRRRARELGVAGCAANRPDGALEAVLEGAPEAVEQMLALCRTGPSRARVTGVDVHEEPPQGLAGFNVA